MSDHIPTTSQVRSAYAVDGIGAPSITNGIRFDRWMQREITLQAVLIASSLADEREAEVRESIAREIEEAATSAGCFEPAQEVVGVPLAARIARGTTKEDTHD